MHVVEVLNYTSAVGSLAGAGSPQDEHDLELLLEKSGEERLLPAEREPVLADKGSPHGGCLVGVQVLQHMHHQISVQAPRASMRQIQGNLFEHLMQRASFRSLLLSILFSM